MNKAFISYSHEADAKLARALESSLEVFAKPWFRIRSFQVFRDDSDLSVNPQLWRSIEEELDRSEYLIYLASPGAAASHWVEREIDCWLSGREHALDKLLIVLTDGNLVWDAAASDFDRDRTTCLPELLRGKLEEEPRYLDLRWAKEEKILTLDDPRFHEAVADLAATLHGVPKNTILGEEVRQHRKVKRLTGSAVIALTILTAASLIGAYFGFSGQERAEAARVRSQFVQAVQNIEAKNVPTGMAYLGAVLRADPQHVGAASRVWSLLTQRSFPLAINEVRYDRWVETASFSPDGRRFATATADGTVGIWEVGSGKAVTPSLRHAGKVNSAMFSRDGAWLISASDDGTARLWDARSGEELRRFSHVAESPETGGGQVARGSDPPHVRASMLSPDSRHAVTASTDGTARLWDAHTGAEVWVFRHEGPVNTAGFSPDGRKVITASSDHSARIWAVETGQELHRLSAHAGSVLTARFDSLGRRVVTASADKTAIIWDVETGANLQSLVGHGSDLIDARFSPDGKLVATASFDDTVRLWSDQDGRQLPASPIVHVGPVWSLQFSADGRHLLTASGDFIISGEARLIDVRTGKDAVQPMRHSGEVEYAEFDPSEQRVVTASRDNSARVWDVRDRRASPTIIENSGWTVSADFSPDGKSVVTASADGTARIWDVATGRPLTPAMSHGASVNSARFSPDGEWIVTVSDDNLARLWDARTATLRTELRGHTDKVVSAGFSADGAVIYTVSDDGSVRIWDVHSGRPLGGPLVHEVRPECADMSPDHRYLVTTAFERKAFLWDLEEGRSMELEGHTCLVMCARFSPDGKRVATASYDGSVRLWEAATGAPAGIPLRHEQVVEGRECAVDWVTAFDFSPDGRAIATGTETGDVRVWEADSGKELFPSIPFGRGLRGMSFSPDGYRLLVHGTHEARIWDVATGQPVGDEIRFPVDSVAWSPDSARVSLVQKQSNSMVILDAGRFSDLAEKGAALIASLVETIGERRFDQSSGRFEPIPFDVYQSTLAAWRQLPGRDIAETLAKWSVSDPSARAISPLSKIVIGK